MIKFSATLLATLIAASVNAATVDLRIMETTDLHSNMMDFDYYKDTATEKFGNDSNLLIVFYVQIMPDDFVMQLHRF